MNTEIAKTFAETALITGHMTTEPTGATLVGFMLRIPPGSTHLQVLESAGLLGICEDRTPKEFGVTTSA